MNNIQLECGFTIPAITRKWKERGVNEAMIDALLAKVTVFEVETDLDVEKRVEEESLIWVLHNLLLRGTPTFLWFDLERELSEKLGSLEEFEKLGTVSHEYTGGKELLRYCWKALHLIDPRVSQEAAFKAYQKSWEKLDSRFEERFLYKEIPEKLFNGKGGFLIQLFEPQRSLNSMVESSALKQAMRHNFQEQKADFVLEFPYQDSNEAPKGICLEVDGPHHQQANQEHLDRQRDRATLESGWHPTFRLPVQDFGTAAYEEKLAAIEEALRTKSIHIYQENYESPLYEHPMGRLALQLALSPLAIARLQLSLARAIISGALSLKAENWKIAIIERDVPCAHLAVENFRNLFGQLSGLENQGKRLPEIELAVFNTPEFENFELNQGLEIRPSDQIEAGKEVYDLCLDISMLCRKGWQEDAPELKARAKMVVRSAFSKEQENPFLCGNRINWRPIVEEDGKTPIPEAEGHLTYFLRNVFRKKAFRPGQLPILHYALQNKTVIGLLPTGGGKSLTYQIAGLLQPGIVLVVDPIKSLMKDQVDGLKRNGVNRTVFINSMLKNYEDRRQAYEKMQSGTALFCFVSPERLQMQSFRNYLQEMAGQQLFFTYGVIDEVHCVSEWGHDFRTSYLSLGENLLRYCHAKEGNVALFGLTATASFDVLADVQRELSGNDPGNEIPDDHIIRHETTNRDEIQFIIDQVELSGEEETEIVQFSTPDNFEWKIKTQLGKKKQERIRHWIENIPSKIEEFNTHPEQVVNKGLIQLTFEPSKPYPEAAEIFHQIQLPQNDLHNFWNSDGQWAGLVFAPHRSWYFGVSDKYKDPERSAGIYDFLATENQQLRFGTYMGADDELSPNVAEQTEEDNIRNQEAFLENQLDVMVSTKAFGMGIDKPNIRFTIHNNYPGSIESFVQEAGRGGRDRKMAVSIILFNGQRFQYNGTTPPFEPDFDIQTHFHYNNFKGPWKEKAVLYELLSEIQYPRVTHAQELAIRLGEKLGDYGEEVAFRISYSLDYNSIWLNDKEGKTYGFLNRSSGYVNTKYATVDQEIARNCLSSLWDVLEEFAPLDLNNGDFNHWLRQKKEVESQPGIEKLLEGKEVGERLALTIPFTNDGEAVFRNVARICLNLDQRITADLVKEKFSIHADEFLENLASHLEWSNRQDKVNTTAATMGISPERFLQRLSYRLGSKRDKADTEKALYRLSLPGVVEEYTVDFRTETFEATIIKKTDEQYHQHLRHYLGKFYSTRRVDRIIEQLHQRQGNTEIQRILNFLVEFIYEEIGKKRFESIKAMRELCEMGLKQGNIEIKSWIHLYFNSKYARRGYVIEVEKERLQEYRTLKSRKTEKGRYNASLLDWTEEGKRYKIHWVFDFMQVVQDDSSGGQIDNLKHLRGACTRLLIVNPDNYVFRLLRGYALILLSERLPIKQVNFEVILSDLSMGWEAFAQEKATEQKVFHLMMQFRDAVLSQIGPENEDFLYYILEIFDELAFLHHVNWAKKFSRRLDDQLQPLVNHE